MKENFSLEIEEVMEVVRKGGAFMTGVNVYNNRGDLILEGDTLVNRFSALYRLKRLGLVRVPIDPLSEGNVWDATGEKIYLRNESDSSRVGPSRSHPIDPVSRVESQIQGIREMREIALQLQSRAREQMIKVVEVLQAGEDHFEVQPLQEIVREILYLTEQNENLFAFLSPETETHHHYLIHQSIHVCALGASVLKKFQDQFAQMVESSLPAIGDEPLDRAKLPSFLFYQKNEVEEIVLGYLLRDIGIFLLPQEVLFKKGTLTEEEFELIKSHSCQQGPRVLGKNGLTGALMNNVVSYHHAPLYLHEERSYPVDKLPIKIPAYVKICRLVDTFWAMISKRSYHEAANPVSVVTEVVRRYSNKDPYLQLILAAFVKVVGIYPPGSVVHMLNGQLAYVLESSGPTILPVTDSFLQPLSARPEPIDLALIYSEESLLRIDRRKPLLTPADYQKILPDYLK